MGVAAFFYRGLAQGQRPSVEDVQEYFRTFWRLETQHRPIRCGMKDTQESLLDLGVRMLAVVCGQARPGIEIVAVEQPFAVPLVDQETGGRFSIAISWAASTCSSATPRGWSSSISRPRRGSIRTCR